MGSNIDVASTGALVNRLMNPPDMGAQFAKGLDTLNAWKQFQANQAAADAYKQSVDPTTGAFDQGKFNALTSQGPGSWNFGETMRSSGAGFGAQSQATTANLQSTMAQLGATAQFLYPLLQKATAPGGVVSPQEAQAELDRAHGLGLINNQVYANTSEQIRQIPPGGNANSIVIGASIGNEGAMHALGGNVEYHDVGGQVVPVQKFPLGYGFGGGPQVLPKSLTPGETIQTTQVPIPGGKSATVPLWVANQGGEMVRRYLEETQPPGYVPGSFNASTYQPPSAPPAGGVTAPGRYPKPPQPPPAEPAQPSWAQKPPPSSEGGYGVTAGAGYEKTAGASRDAANALQAQITQAQDIKPTLSDMESNIRQGATTGVGAVQLGSLRQLLINFGLTPDRSAGDNPNQASAQAAQEEFNKNSALLQGYQLQSLGRPSDARQELSEQSRPGGAISPQGNLNLIHMFQGNQQAIEVVGKAWAQAQKAGWSPDRFNEWANDHFYTASDAATGGKFNRRVFWMANAPNLKAQQEIYNNIPNNQKEQFKKDLRYAGSQGWVTQDADGSYRPGSP